MKVHELFEDEERSILSVLGEQDDVYVGNYNCTDLMLTSLKGAPEKVGGSFSCSNNRLTTLEGGPSSVGDDFFCIDNELTTLKGASASVGNFYCNDNKITSLEGAPTSVGKYFVCSRNQLTSLHNIHKHIKYIGHFADFSSNPITSSVLGLLLIEGLQKVGLQNQLVQMIVNKHLEGDQDVFACQEELLEAGLEDFAKL